MRLELRPHAGGNAEHDIRPQPHALGKGQFAGVLQDRVIREDPFQLLGIEDALYRILRSTNAIENLNGSVADYTKNVKRWRGGRMILRWVGAAVVEASKRFRKIRGHRDLRQLVLALQNHELKQGVQTNEEAA